MAEEEVKEGAEGKEVELPDLAEDAAEGTEVATTDAAGSVGEGEVSSEVEGPRSASDLEAVYDVPVNISAVLGKTQLEVSSLLTLSRGAVIELDRKVGEAIDIYVNNRLVARGEVVLVEEKLGVTMTEIIQSDRQ